MKAKIARALRARCPECGCTLSTHLWIMGVFGGLSAVWLVLR